MRDLAKCGHLSEQREHFIARDAGMYAVATAPEIHLERAIGIFERHRRMPHSVDDAENRRRKPERDPERGGGDRKERRPAAN